MFTSARVGVPHIAVLVTHINSLDTAATQREADLTRRAGINIIAVGVGGWLDMSELRAAVSYPADRNTLHVDSYETLGTAVHAIRDAACGSACTVCVFLARDAMPKRMITQTTPHDSTGTLVFCRPRSPRTGVTPTGSPHAGGVGQNRRLSTNNRLYLENGTR